VTGRVRTGGSFAAGVGEDQRAAIDRAQEQGAAQVGGAPPRQRHAPQGAQWIEVHDHCDAEWQTLCGDGARRLRGGFEVAEAVDSAGCRFILARTRANSVEGDNDLTSRMAAADVVESRADLLERIAPVDGRAQLSLARELSEQFQVPGHFHSR